MPPRCRHSSSGPDVRWVTLTGPGGVGKTRLAAHVARTMSDAFAGATYFVPLAGVADADHLVSSLVLMLDVHPGAGETPWTAVTRHLRALAVPLLLILDNFEHIATAAVEVAALVERCETVKILASSRARLNVSAEHEYQVLPLVIPDGSRVRRAATVADVPAVRLFVERARAARAGFALTDENAGAIADICLALDGLPLAIELAAARVKMIPPEALLARVAGKSLSLDGGARDRPARQQTLRATIDWGYELLTPAEQRLFRRLAVFVRGWTLEGAEAVCDARQDLGIDVFDGVSSLIDKSLVRAMDGGVCRTPFHDAVDDPRVRASNGCSRWAKRSTRARPTPPTTWCWRKTPVPARPSTRRGWRRATSNMRTCARPWTTRSSRVWPSGRCDSATRSCRSGRRAPGCRKVETR